MKANHKPVAYKDDIEFYTPEQYKSFDTDLQEDLIPLYLGADSMDTNEISMYEFSWKLETLQYKIENVKHIIDLLATDISDNTHSGALWCIYDTLTTLAGEVDKLAGEAHLSSIKEKEPQKKKKK